MINRINEILTYTYICAGVSTMYRLKYKYPIIFFLLNNIFSSEYNYLVAFHRVTLFQLSKNHYHEYSGF